MVVISELQARFFTDFPRFVDWICLLFYRYFTDGYSILTWWILFKVFLNDVLHNSNSLKVNADSSNCPCFILWSMIFVTKSSILMLADSLEAAAKSLKVPTSESIDDLVTKIIDHKIKQGQLDESALTFNELELCKTSFKKTLKSIHHVRIEYPSVK